MIELVKLTEARKAVAGSKQRREKIIGLLNANIMREANKGMNWCAFPEGLTVEEQDWLRDVGTEAGYKVESVFFKW